MKLQLLSGEPSWRDVLDVFGRFLTFRSTHKELRNASWKQLLLALFGVWIAGVGRWWDSPSVSLLQNIGVGSLAYVLALSLFLWLFFYYSTGGEMKYKDCLLAVSMTGPVAFIYAIPVERFMDADSAAAANGIALLVVSLYRVSLLWFYLRVGWGMSRKKTFGNIFTPIAVIIGVFSVFQLFAAVATSMSGIRKGATVTPAESAITGVTSWLFCLSPVIFLAALAMYITTLSEPANGDSF